MDKKKAKNKTSLQFKLTLMFFFVMLVSASISVSVLVMVCSPVMKSNAEQQLVELSMAMDQLEEKGGFTVDEIVSIVNNSAYSLSVVDKNDSRVHDHFADIVHKGYYVSSEGVVPNATIISQVYDKFVIIDSFSSDSVYWVVNLVVIIAFMVCIVIGTIITAFMSRSIIQPIRDLSAAAAEIAKGNFKVRVREPSDPEYSILVQNFNKMAEELAGTETLRGDFISNVSHEFKTPLASIQGFAKLLQSDDITEQEREEYTQIIIDETSRLSKLSSNILRLTKLENQKTVGKKTRFSLDEQIRKILLVLEPEWSKKKIDLDIDLEDIMYVGSEELMAQIWQNIINNAIKFTPEGGKISVKLFRNEKNISAEIWDNGPSIAPDVKAKIFDKFYQGDRSRATEGNGLGLALVKRIIELSEGSIEVENDMKKGGVCFRISLPYLIEDMM
ncbi:HAMP domain-containing sensor histidine kinase [Ruminococcus sp.]|uniref:sensor histidine kinase n=1 Tax=Ruminococcus sp. TaxID=41978 RepID=UPI003A97C44F